MFVNHARFRELIAADAFLEWEEVHGQLYGTGRGVLAGAPLDSWTIFDIDVKGGLALRERFPGAVTLFVLPPSLAVLEARLRGRRTESEAAIQARLAASWHEIERGIERYDYAIINSDLEQAVSDVVAVMRAEDLWLEAVRPLLRKTYVGSAFIAEMPPMQKDG